MSKKINIESEIEKLARNDFLIFLLEKWKISSGDYAGEQFSMRERPYLLGMIKDNFPFIVKMKSAQSSISEIEMARAIHFTIKEKGNILYTFPAGEQMQQFVDARPRNAIINNSYLQQFVTGSLNLKKFSLNNNQIYFRGVQKRQQMISVDASKLFADELDTYEDESKIHTLNKRLGNTRNPYRSYFSTPSFHAMGISLYYYGNEASKEKGSDQRVWTIRCESCGQWNEDLLWEENIIDLNEKDNKFSYYEPNIIVICRHCKKPLNRLSANAEWIPTITANSDYCHGYHISKLFAPTANLNQLWMDSKNPIKEQEFYNSDLGLPFEPKGSRLTDANLDACRGNYQIQVVSKEENFAGVDIGNKIHVVAGKKEENKFKIITVQELEDWSDLDSFYRNFNIKRSVIDMNPEKDEAMIFQKSHEGTWLTYFSQHLERTTETFNKNWDDQIIGIHRTLMMMLVSDLICEKSVILPINIRMRRDFYEHMKSPIKAQKQDAQGNPITFYPKTKNPDHYYFAMLYFFIATQLRPSSATVKYKNLYV